MANTTLLKGEVEMYVRQQLAAEYAVAFSADFLPLPTGARHEFDAVSADRRVVASIKSASGKTSGGRIPVGKIHSSVAELYFLSLISASTRLLVLTNPEFYTILHRTLEGRLVQGISLKLVELPHDLAERVRQVHARASREVSGWRHHLRS